MVSTALDVGSFNAIRYVLTSLLLLPCLEWALQNTIESLAAKHLLAGGIVRWDGQRLGRLSPVPYFYSRNTRLFAMAACVLIHSASLFGEFGFGAEPIWTYKAFDQSRINSSIVPAYIMECNKTEFRISFLKEEPFRSVTEQTNSPADCRNRKKPYSDSLGYSYGVLNDEISSNLQSVTSSMAHDTQLDWRSATCPDRKDGVLRYTFSVTESDSRKYVNELIDVPLKNMTATLFIHYRCKAEENVAGMFAPLFGLENLTGLVNITNQPGLKLKQNETFACLGLFRFRGFFCFSNRTSTVDKLYHTIDDFPGSDLPFETMYQFAEFDPPVEVSRMYFVLAGISNYEPLMQRFKDHGTELVKRYYSTIGSVLTLLLAMPEVLAPEGIRVRSMSNRRTVATIDKVGAAYLGFLSVVTIVAIFIALSLMHSATKDSRGRTVKVRSGPGYVIDLIENEVLGNEDRASSNVSPFGLALSSNQEGQQHICISREGNPFEGGIITGRFDHTCTDTDSVESLY